MKHKIYIAAIIVSICLLINSISYAWTGDTWGSLTRAEITSIASEMIDSHWIPKSTIHNWAYGSDSHYFYSGTLYTGEAYSQNNPQENWNEFFLLVNTTAVGSTFYGNDCSGFASIAWRLPQRYTTALFESDAVQSGGYVQSLGAIGNGAQVALLQGDALNDDYNHIILFNRYVSGGMESMEQTPYTARRKTWSWSQLSTYRPIRRNLLTGGGPAEKTLVRCSDDPDPKPVYWLQNSKRYHVLSPQIAEEMTNAGLQGWTWPNVNEYSASILNQYPIGPEFIATDSKSNGLLISETGDIKVYLVWEGKKRHVMSSDAMNWGGRDWWPDVIEVSSSVMSTYIPNDGYDLYALGEGGTGDVRDEVEAAYVRNINANSSGYPGQYCSYLLFPTSQVNDAYQSGHSGISGKYQRYEYYETIYGGINWSSQHGAFEYHGAIGKKYQELGFSSSQLGYPVSDDYQWGSYRRSDFEGGYVYWDSSTDQTHVEYTACTYSISPASKAFTSSGGSGTVGVTAPSGCSWTAASNKSWIAITSGSSDNGNGTVHYSVSANSSKSLRTGTMTIAGKIFTIEQDPPPPCTFSISPTSKHFSYSGGSQVVAIDASRSDCSWTASEGLSWVTLSKTSGTGDGSVTVTVSSNSGGSRTGTVTIAGKTFSITQDPVYYTLTVK